MEEISTLLPSKTLRAQFMRAQIISFSYTTLDWLQFVPLVRFSKQTEIIKQDQEKMSKHSFTSKRSKKRYETIKLTKGHDGTQDDVRASETIKLTYRSDLAILDARNRMQMAVAPSRVDGLSTTTRN